MEKLTSTITLSVDSHYSSPYALSAYVALLAKKLPFDVVAIDLYSNQHQTGDFARQSLTARVPVLTDGGFALSESSAICEYLDEQYSAPQYAALYPQKVQLRARARQVQAWVRSDLMPIRTERSTHTVFYTPSVTPLSEDAQKAAAKLISVAETLITDPNTGIFGAWCIADTDLTMMLMRLVNSGDPVPEKVLRYVKQQWQHPSIQQWLAMPRPAIAN
jgi:glutathione S-transferase